MSVCGVAPIGVPGIENIDLSGVVTQVRARLAVSHGRRLQLSVTSFLRCIQHTHYCTKMNEILEFIDLASTGQTTWSSGV
jgi:hypothetical protein